MVALETWRRNGVRKVECMRVRRNSPRVFTDSDCGCHSFASEVAVFDRRRTTNASAVWPRTYRTSLVGTSRSPRRAVLLT